MGPIEEAAEGPVGTTVGATGPTVGPDFVRRRAAEVLRASTSRSI